jgi:hypothetical protein
MTEPFYSHKGDPELFLALWRLAQEMLDDGDCYVEHYGKKLVELIKNVS